jgi:hypothetical protein
MDFQTEDELLFEVVLEEADRDYEHSLFFRADERDYDQAFFDVLKSAIAWCDAHENSAWLIRQVKYCSYVYSAAQHGVQPTDTAAAGGGESDQSPSRADVGG